MNTDLMFSSVTPEWETPPEIFDPLQEEFTFTLDVCATPANAKVPTYLTREDDALNIPWWGRCWMNPPYGREIGKWVKKAHDETENRIRFLKGRVKFLLPHGVRLSSAPFPSAIVVFHRP